MAIIQLFGSSWGLAITYATTKEVSSRIFTSKNILIMDQSQYLKELSLELGIPMIPCESSNIEGYAYNSKEQKLWIAFKGNKVYSYNKVPHQIADGLHQAESKGKFVHKFIRNKFETEGYEFK
jgi:hypothetical protein